MIGNFSEQELIQGCIKEKPEYQRALYKKFARTMYGICIRYTKDTMEAEDMLQQGFMKVFTHLGDFRGGSLEGWMKRIFVRESIDHYRKNKRSALFQTEEILDYQSVTLEEITAGLHMEALLNLIESLPEGCRVIFNLYAVEGYNHKEIAEMLRISESTSKSQYARAKELLKDKIFAIENGKRAW